MGIIKDEKKFNRTTNPTNLTANINQKTNIFDIKSNTIKEQLTKK